MERHSESRSFEATNPVISPIGDNEIGPMQVNPRHAMGLLPLGLFLVGLSACNGEEEVVCPGQPFECSFEGDYFEIKLQQGEEVNLSGVFRSLGVPEEEILDCVDRSLWHRPYVEGTDRCSYSRVLSFRVNPEGNIPLNYGNGEFLVEPDVLINSVVRNIIGQTSSQSIMNKGVASEQNHMENVAVQPVAGSRELNTWEFCGGLTAIGLGIISVFYYTLQRKEINRVVKSEKRKAAASRVIHEKQKIEIFNNGNLNMQKSRKEIDPEAVKVLEELNKNPEWINEAEGTDFEVLGTSTDRRGRRVFVVKTRSWWALGQLEQGGTPVVGEGHVDSYFPTPGGWIRVFNCIQRRLGRGNETNIPPDEN
ncbi:hypothetical protein KJ632_00865 [Patescibacteria group bacterium]|nr:hypothetical protein [Patescibacteria group bacterium]